MEGSLPVKHCVQLVEGSLPCGHGEVVSVISVVVIGSVVSVVGSVVESVLESVVESMVVVSAIEGIHPL